MSVRLQQLEHYCLDSDYARPERALELVHIFLDVVPRGHITLSSPIESTVFFRKMGFQLLDEEEEVRLAAGAQLRSASSSHSSSRAHYQ
jgi:hypothetical protein